MKATEISIGSQSNERMLFFQKKLQSMPPHAAPSTNAASSSQVSRVKQERGLEKEEKSRTELMGRAEKTGSFVRQTLHRRRE